MAEFRLLLPDDRGIMGSVNDEGELSFVIVAGEGSPIRGTEMFDLMMRSFGDQVRAIYGVWRTGHDGRPSTNLDKVNELTSTGLSLEEAVRFAWTVTRAARWGFTKVKIAGSPKGTPGNYTKVDVRIEKDVK